MFFYRRLPLFLLCLLGLSVLAAATACVKQPDHSATAACPPPLSPPLTIMDGADFAIFSKRFRSELYHRGILTADGTPTPETPLLLLGTSQPDGEYQPESFGRELFNRLSLRFMWPVEERQRVQDVPTHATMPSSGETVTVDDSSLVVVGEFSTDIYKVVALLDWDRDGVRDWLVRYRFQPSVDMPASSRMLVIPAPQAEGLLEAQIIEAVECDESGCKSYTGPALPDVLGYDPAVPAVPARLGTGNEQTASDG